MVADIPLEEIADELYEQQIQPPVKKWFSTRFSLVYLAGLGTIVMHMMRASLDIVIIPMNPAQVDKLRWEPKEMGVVLSAFYYGYFVTQLPGGYLATKFGGKLLFGGGILWSSVLTLLTPIAARAGLAWLVALRVLTGLGEGVVLPALLSLLGVWAPPLERSQMVSIAFSGIYLGFAASQAITGAMSISDVLGGWSSVFYVFGSVGLFWSIFWFCMVSDTPENHPRISSQEREYIESNIASTPSRPAAIPWLEIVKSKNVWAVMVLQFINMWGLYTLVTSLPLYLREVLRFTIPQNGFISALPYLITFLTLIFGGIAADEVQKSQLLSTTNTRLVWSSVGSSGAGVLMVITGIVGCNRVVAVSIISAAAGFIGFQLASSLPNLVDIAPRYSGLLMGISNTLNTIPVFLVPFLVGVLTENAVSRTPWVYVFIISFIIYAAGTILYIAFGSGKEQHWNKDENDEENACLLN